MSFASFEILPKLLGYRLSYMLGFAVPAPINLTYSITNLCQSKCLSCNIWRYYRDEPAKLKQELSLEEVEKVFRSVGHVYFFNISGGEPFLRKDIEQIVELALRYLSPKVMHCPTNALCPSRVISGTRTIMETVRRFGDRTIFTIKPSFDGVGDEHDRVRGVKGNFKRLVETVEGLKGLQSEFPNLKVGLGTVISKMNIDRLPEIMDKADELAVDTYISEVAEHRVEMSNLADDITPEADRYQSAVRRFKDRIEKSLAGLSGLARVTQTLRTLYYDLAARILREKKQVIPCYAGISNVHLSPYGDVWSCAILANTQSMGNVRETSYDFWRIWGSDRAGAVRKFIKDRNCACPLANQSYANLLLHIPSMLKAIRTMILPPRPRTVP